MDSRNARRARAKAAFSLAFDADELAARLDALRAKRLDGLNFTEAHRGVRSAELARTIVLILEAPQILDAATRQTMLALARLLGKRGAKNVIERLTEFLEEKKTKESELIIKILTLKK